MGTIAAIGSSTKLVNCVSCMVRFIAGEAAFCNRVCQFLGAPMYTETVRLLKAAKQPEPAATVDCFRHDELTSPAANTPLTLVLVELASVTI
ncbi:MAG: hypothetical protein P3M75_00140 [Candidatus Hodgkinia cicadicola]|nr:MAG: hypothetical protein P3M75_00140 [Candidatus Hodgkinia cicadicola]